MFSNSAPCCISTFRFRSKHLFLHVTVSVKSMPSWQCCLLLKYPRYLRNSYFSGVKEMKVLVFGWRLTDSRVMVEEWVGDWSGATDRNTFQDTSLDSSIVQPGAVTKFVRD